MSKKTLREQTARVIIEVPVNGGTCELECV